MILDKIHSKIIEDLFEEIKQNTLTRANLGVLKKDSSKDLVSALDSIPLMDLLDLDSKEKYDLWFDNQIVLFHKKIFPLYRDYISVDIDNPYTYSARMATQYIKQYTIKTFQFNQEGVADLSIIHPVISNKFIESFPELNISQVKEITTKQIYYKIVDFYRQWIFSNKESGAYYLNVEVGTDI